MERSENLLCSSDIMPILKAYTYHLIRCVRGKTLKDFTHVSAFALCGVKPRHPGFPICSLKDREHYLSSAFLGRQVVPVEANGKPIRSTLGSAYSNRQETYRGGYRISRWHIFSRSERRYGLGGLFASVISYLTGWIKFRLTKLQE